MPKKQAKPVQKEFEEKSVLEEDESALERLLILKAMQLAKKQLDEGTASSAVITHFLKLGASTAVIERDLLESQAEVFRAKSEAIKREKESEASAKEALEAFRSYQSNK